MLLFITQCARTCAYTNIMCACTLCEHVHHTQRLCVHIHYVSMYIIHIHCVHIVWARTSYTYIVWARTSYTHYVHRTYITCGTWPIGGIHIWSQDKSISLDHEPVNGIKAPPMRGNLPIKKYNKIDLSKVRCNQLQRKMTEGTQCNK